MNMSTHMLHALILEGMEMQGKFPPADPRWERISKRLHVLFAEMANRKAAGDVYAQTARV